VFASDLDETSSFIKKMCGSAPKWFRAPSGKISPGMSAELKKRDMLHVMLDGYANDPHIPDARFIASTMLRAATDGSVLIIHMPESGFREWCFEAIDLLLKGLKAKGLKSVTLSELKEAAEGKKTK
jgi:peptidoglycan/xylan/chitin deacetylase (PgdA/CDA1 family)